MIISLLCNAINQYLLCYRSMLSYEKDISTFKHTYISSLELERPTKFSIEYICADESLSIICADMFMAGVLIA